MVETLGWLNIGLILLMGTIYPMKKLYLNKRKKSLLLLYRKAKFYHPILGFIIVIIGLIHGYTALGTIRLHTGIFILFTVILMGCITALGRKKLLFKKKWLAIHSNLSLLLLLFIIIHIFFRNII